MSNNWYLVPSTGSNTALDPRRPKYADRFEGYSSLFIEQTGLFIVRFFEKSSAHDKTGNEDDAVSFSPQKATSRLNDATGSEYTIEQWENKFFVEQ
jgi:hypothetical protein